MMTIMMMMMMIMTDLFTTNLVVKGTVVKGSVVKGAHPHPMMMMMMVQVKPVEEDRRPSAVYLDVIVRGAKENGLPEVGLTFQPSPSALFPRRCGVVLLSGVHREAAVH